jgi:hypothetical protein
MSFGAPEASPGWKLYAGILFAALGAGFVLYSKEEMEKNAAAAAKKAPAAETAPANGAASPQGAPPVTRD